jgi:hypothetical protein
MVLSVPPLKMTLHSVGVCVQGWQGAVGEIGFKAARTKGVTVFLRTGTVENHEEP